MTVQALPAVRRGVTVKAPIERAFEAFTTSFDKWWPRGHHIGTADMAEAVLEPRADGRWYEKGVDGSECEWGRVLAWEPPHRLVLSWHIGGDWQYHPDPAQASEVEVRFTAEGPDATRVEIEHRLLERHGESGRSLHDSVGTDEGGWGGLLQLFRGVAEAS
jgi:uncharacterized protein YndB with AHSA1/START domain